MGIQAFEPVLVEGNAIKLHPLVCKGFNADFDGDQMAVHLPLSIEAQVEAHTLMMSTNNIFSPANGSLTISPSQDAVMGCYYLTAAPLPAVKGDGMKFSSFEEVQLAYSLGKVATHARRSKSAWPKAASIKNERLRQARGSLIKTTVGRVMFNDDAARGHGLLQHAAAAKGSEKMISDCYEILGRRTDDRTAGHSERIGFRAEHHERPELRHRRPDHAAQQAEDHQDAEKSVLQHPQAVPARHHHRGRALQPGDGRLDPRPRRDHLADDGGAGERPPRRPTYLNPIS